MWRQRRAGAFPSVPDSMIAQHVSHTKDSPEGNHEADSDYAPRPPSVARVLTDHLSVIPQRIWTVDARYI